MQRYSYAILPAALCAFFIAGSALAATPEGGGPAGHNRVAVVKGKYDDVDLVLDNYRIPYDLLEVRDMEDPERLAPYRSLFLPSGADTPLEESLEVYASRLRFQSVTLKRDYHEVDREKIARSLRSFIRGGGSAYVSGYCFEYLQDAFGLFDFFDDFPFMGMPSRVEAELKGDLSRFALKNRMALYPDHPGWIAVQSVRDAEVIAEGTFETPRGARSGPISFIARRGSGEVLYTSYDSTVFSDFRRFNVYRIAGADLMRDLEADAGRWGRRITGRIVGAVHAGEWAAGHRIDLRRGRNVIYFRSGRDIFQVEVRDEEGFLLESRDHPVREHRFIVDASRRGHCVVRLYPSPGKRFGTYAVISAAGWGLPPALSLVLPVIGGLLAAAAAAFAVYRLFFSGGYSGRWRG